MTPWRGSGRSLRLPPPRPAMPPIPTAGRVALAVVLVAAAGCTALHPPTARTAAPPALSTETVDAVRAGVLATLDAQVEAWNGGSVRGFMDGYARADTLTFLSGGSVRTGWEETLYGYVRGYPDAAAMGTLAFEDLTVHPLSRDRALAWGRWRLTRADDAPGGLFTLVLAQTPEGWRVVHDHTSSE